MRSYVEDDFSANDYEFFNNRIYWEDVGQLVEDAINKSIGYPIISFEQWEALTVEPELVQNPVRYSPSIQNTSTPDNKIPDDKGQYSLFDDSGTSYNQIIRDNENKIIKILKPNNISDFNVYFQDNNKYEEYWTGKLITKLIKKNKPQYKESDPYSNIRLSLGVTRDRSVKVILRSMKDMHHVIHGGTSEGGMAEQIYIKNAVLANLESVIRNSVDIDKSKIEQRKQKRYDDTEIEHFHRLLFAIDVPSSKKYSFEGGRWYGFIICREAGYYESKNPIKVNFYDVFIVPKDNKKAANLSLTPVNSGSSARDITISAKGRSTITPRYHNAERVEHYTRSWSRTLHRPTSQTLTPESKSNDKISVADILKDVNVQQYLIHADPANMKYFNEKYGRNYRINENSRIYEDESSTGYNQLGGLDGARYLDKRDKTTIRRDNLEIAKQMLTDGKSMSEIWTATGWNRNSDGKWRFEMQDGKLNDKLNANAVLHTRDNYTPHIAKSRLKYVSPEALFVRLKDLYNAPELQAAYGKSFADKCVVAFDNLSDKYGWSDAFNNIIALDKNTYLKQGVNGFEFVNENNELVKTLIHEIQHIIQVKEGFAQGIDPNYYLDDIFKKYNVTDFDADRFYRNSAGEIEARNTESRYDMSDTERQRVAPSESELSEYSGAKINSPYDESVDRYYEQENKAYITDNSAYDSTGYNQLVRENLDKYVVAQLPNYKNGFGKLIKEVGERNRYWMPYLKKRVGDKLGRPLDRGIVVEFISKNDIEHCIHGDEHSGGSTEKLLARNVVLSNLSAVVRNSVDIDRSFKKGSGYAHRLLFAVDVPKGLYGSSYIQNDRRWYGFLLAKEVKDENNVIHFSLYDIIPVTRDIEIKNTENKNAAKRDFSPVNSGSLNFKASFENQNGSQADSLTQSVNVTSQNEAAEPKLSSDNLLAESHGKDRLSGVRESSVNDKISIADILRDDKIQRYLTKIDKKNNNYFKELNKNVVRENSVMQRSKVQRTESNPLGLNENEIAYLNDWNNDVGTTRMDAINPETNRFTVGVYVGDKSNKQYDGSFDGVYNPETGQFEPSYQNDTNLYGTSYNQTGSMKPSKYAFGDKAVEDSWRNAMDVSETQYKFDPVLEKRKGEIERQLEAEKARREEEYKRQLETGKIEREEEYKRLGKIKQEFSDAERYGWELTDEQYMKLENELANLKKIKNSGIFDGIFARCGKDVKEFFKGFFVGDFRRLKNHIGAREAFRMYGREHQGVDSLIQNDMTQIFTLGPGHLMNAEEYDLFSRFLILQDMMITHKLLTPEEYRLIAGEYGKGARQNYQQAQITGPLPFKFTPEMLRQEYDRFAGYINANPEMARAVVRNRKKLAELNNELIKAGEELNWYDLLNKLRNPAYFHHEVLEVIVSEKMIKDWNEAAERAKNNPDGKLKVNAHGYYKPRAESSVDYSTDYLTQMYRVITQKRHDIATLRLLNRLQKSSDNIIEDLREQAFCAKNGYANILNEIKKFVYGEDVDEYLKNDIIRLAEKGELPMGKNNEYGKVINDICEEASKPHEHIDEIDLHNVDGFDDYIEWLATLNPTGPVGNNQNNKITYFSLIPSGYKLYDPNLKTTLLSTRSPMEQMLTEATKYGLVQNGISMNDIMESDTLGNLHQVMVLPNDIIEQLNEIHKKEKHSKFYNGLKATTDIWKKWVLYNPLRTMKFMLRNLTGDLDAAIAINPRGLAYIPRAAKELWAFFYRGVPMTDDLRDCAARGLMTSSKWHWESLVDKGTELDKQISEDAKKFFKYIEGINIKDMTLKDIAKIPVSLWYGYFDFIDKFSNFREGITRYAMYLSYLDQMKNNNGEPEHYGASKRQEVLAIDDIKDRAYKMANEAIGAYDQVSESGQKIRQIAIPFYSWMELNGVRYWNLFRNAAREGYYGGVGVASGLFVARNLILTYVMSTLLTSLAALWNGSVQGDNEDELPIDVRLRPHITLGRIGNQIIYFDRIGAFADLLDTFGIDRFAIIPNLFQKFSNGDTTFGDACLEVGKTFLSKLINSGNPFPKIAYELYTHKKIYPDAFDPQPMDEFPEGLVKYLASTFNVTPLYNTLGQRPGAKFTNMRGLLGLFLYTQQADEASWWHILNLKNKFLEEKGIKDKDYDKDELYDIRHDLRRALRNGEDDYVVKYVNEYFNTAYKLYQDEVEYHATHEIDKYHVEPTGVMNPEAGLKAAVRALAPTTLLGDRAGEFIAWLRERGEYDMKQFERAQKFYEKLQEDYFRIRSKNPVKLDWDN